MAIASRRGNSKKPINNVIHDRTATVVRVDDYIINMKNYLGGQNYTIDYFSQTKGNADINVQLDEGTPVAQQHYTKIEGLRVKLKEAINTESIDTLKGSMLINKIKPQINDCFKTTLITGDVAVFRISEVLATNYAIDTSYEVNFILDTTDIVDDARIQKLEESVTKTLIYNTDSIHSQSSALLTTSTMDLVTKIENYIYSSTNTYIRKFVNGLISLKTSTDACTYSPTVEELALCFLDDERLVLADTRSFGNSLLVESLSTTTMFTQTYFKNKTKRQFANDYTIRMRMMLPSSVHKLIEEVETIETNTTMPTLSPWLYDGTPQNPYFLYSPNSTCGLSKLITKYLNNEELTNAEVEGILKLTLTTEESYWFTPLLVMLCNYKLSTTYEN